MNSLKTNPRWIAAPAVVLVIACVFAGCTSEMAPDKQSSRRETVAATPVADLPDNQPAERPSETIEPVPRRSTIPALRPDVPKPLLIPPNGRPRPARRDLIRPDSPPRPSRHIAKARRPGPVHPLPASRPLLPAARRMMPPEPHAAARSAPPPAPTLVAERPGPTGAEPKTKPEAKGYTVVKVFYGTDRAAVESGVAGLLGSLPWHYVAMVSAAACVVLVVLIGFIRRRRLLVGLMVGSLLVAVVTGFWTVAIRRPDKAAEARMDREYGNDRGTLVMGTCEVSIPERHEVGELEGPSVFRLEFSEDPTRHIVLLDIKPTPADAFYAELKERIARSGRKEALVFVHGYNVTFEKAARRTAQLAHDLRFDGAAVFYSWPSQGGLLQYTVDETNVVWTVPHLKEFLVGVATRTGARRVHLIAHSMGNRALTAALGRLSHELKREQTPMFHEVVLTAPDIDAEVFRRDIAPAIIQTARRVTLYASSNDEALIASKRFHGYPRAGESGEHVVVVPGIDTIDVSAVDTSLLGHTYYGSNDTVLTDLAQLLLESKPPSRRDRLRSMVLGGMKYWIFLAEQVGLRPPRPAPR